MTIARWPNVVLGPLGERMAKFVERTIPKPTKSTSPPDETETTGMSHITTVFRTAGRRRPRSTSVRTASGVGDVKMRDFAKWLYDNYADFTVELIHSTPFADDHGFYVKNQKRNPGGSVYGGLGSSGISITSTGRRRRR